MPFWNLKSSRPAFVFSLCLLVFSGLVMVSGGNARAEAVNPANTSAWNWQPWLTLGGGHENDLVLDPDFNRTVVPGGTFMDGVAGFSLTRPLSHSTRFRLLNRSSLERFLNNSGRTLFAGTMLGDFRFARKSPWQGRVTLSGDYFNDSGSVSFRRFGGGLESGLGLRYPHWSFELSGFYQGRRYPNVQVALTDQQVETYTEGQWGTGALLAWNPVGGVFIRGRFTGKTTSAADPTFDSTSWTTNGSLDLNLGQRSRLSAAYTHQSRNFDNRVSTRNNDSYDRIGMGLTHKISSRLRLDGRYAYSTYRYPQGGEQNTSRFSLAATFLWQNPRSSLGRSAPNPLPIDQPLQREGNIILFRIFAPQASKVTVAGTFNQWQPQDLKPSPAQKGWWQLNIHLEPGAYEYTYAIDGKVTTPPEATRTTDDGFGGRNGILFFNP